MRAQRLRGSAIVASVRVARRGAVVLQHCPLDAGLCGRVGVAAGHPSAQLWRCFVLHDDLRGYSLSHSQRCRAWAHNAGAHAHVDHRLPRACAVATHVHAVDPRPSICLSVCRDVRDRPCRACHRACAQAWHPPELK
eukprot:Amastigsp_a516590_12.p3 type:complete len:137 gc:universal Amastigsp_a516590_12:408-818(+)